MKFRITLLLILCLMFYCCLEMKECKAVHTPFDPIDPDDPSVPTYYRMEVKVAYKRDVTKIKTPSASDRFVSIEYELYDPEFTGELADGERMSGGYRIGTASMIKLDENKFEGTIKHVLIQNQKYSEDHGICILDLKLSKTGGLDKFTAENIIVEGAYEIRIFDKMYFKER